ncbi:UNKNOWN [Stylonychia lemnae]|uniref:Uncharacterized protein n=1 Tax=Stylonychia lemnae TaxID=5949 RepID=A0A077ZYQ0_STYLE|nr:UNKNOWN [Stylonychia lemnae]|eukprot:CDW73658.1 UNKNOWN [Stylonychia lemnae]
MLMLISIPDDIEVRYQIQMPKKMALISPPKTSFSRGTDVQVLYSSQMNELNPEKNSGLNTLTKVTERIRRMTPNIQDFTTDSLKKKRYGKVQYYNALQMRPQRIESENDFQQTPTHPQLSKVVNRQNRFSLSLHMEVQFPSFSIMNYSNPFLFQLVLKEFE